jgi:hypothetical protein
MVCSTMSARSVISFCSTSKAPYFVLSNLTACLLVIDGKHYPSVEHWYQSQKVASHASDFECGGKWSTWDAMHLLWKPTNVARKIAYWRRKHSIGIIAKLAINRARIGTRSQRLQVGLTLKPTLLEYVSFKDALELWLPVLLAKVAQNIEVLALLRMHRQDYFLEFSRGAQRQTHHGNPPRWSGMIKDGKLFGENWMGRLWMQVAALDVVFISHEPCSGLFTVSTI